MKRAPAADPAAAIHKSPINKSLAGKLPWPLRLLDGGLNLALLAAILLFAFTSLAAAQSRTVPVPGLLQTPAGTLGGGEKQNRPLAGLFFKVGAADKMLQAPLQYSDVKISISGLIARVKLRQHFFNPSNYWLEGAYIFPLPEGAAVDRLVMRIGARAVSGKILEKQQAKELYLQAKTEGRKASMITAERSNVFITEVANIGPGETIVIDIEYQDTARFDADLFSYRFPMVVAPRYTPPPAGLVRDGGPGLGGQPKAKAQPINARTGDSGDNTAGDLFGPVETDTSQKLNPVALTVTLDPGFQLASLASAYHPVSQTTLPDGRHQLKLADKAGRVTAHQADRDFLVTWKAKAGAAPDTAIFGQQVGNDSFLTLMISPPDMARAKTPRPNRDLILVLDVSGSMHGTSISQAKAALAKALQRLGPQDRFDLVIFSHEARALFGRYVFANPEMLRRALDFVAQLQADGGTNILAGLDVAFALTGAALPGGAGGTANRNSTQGAKNRLKQIVFLTDGAVSNETALFNRIQNSLGDARLFTIGIGSAPNDLFMKKAAEIGRGTFTYIGNLAEVEPRMNALLRKLEQPALTDIKLAWPTAIADKVQVFPNPIPDLYADQPVIVTVRIKNQNLNQIKGDVLLRGITGARPWQKPVAIAKSTPAQGLPAQWARSWIERLKDQMRLATDSDALRREIVDLALKYSLVTEYTALVAIDDRISRPAASDLSRKEIPRALPAGWDPVKVFGAAARPANLQVIPGNLRHRLGLRATPIALPNGATAAQLKLLSGLLLLLGAGLLLAGLYGRQIVAKPGAGHGAAA